jgi:hypothetical protein
LLGGPKKGRDLVPSPRVNGLVCFQPIDLGLIEANSFSKPRLTAKAGLKAQLPNNVAHVPGQGH